MKTLSVEDLERAIDNADVCAMVELGKRFCYGDGVEKNFDRAKELFQKAADLEDADGETWLARCLFTGKGVERNWNLALEYYKRAAAKGHAGAEINLGALYAAGLGAPKDLKQAEQYLGHAADKGLPVAQFYLANLIAACSGTEGDTDRVISLLEAAAKAGESEALAELGRCYEYGTLVPADFARALTYYDQAAAEGNIEAEIGRYRLAAIAANGTGTFDTKKLFELAEVESEHVKGEPQELDFEGARRRQAGFDADNFIDLAKSCDLNGDFENGLKYMRKCMEADGFQSMSPYVQSQIAAWVYFREKEGCTEYFDALATMDGVHLITREKDLSIYVPSGNGGYSAPEIEVIRECVHAWNSALDNRFNITEADDWQSAHIRFVPVERELFSDTCDARTYHPRRKQSASSGSKIQTVFRVIMGLIDRNPFKAYLVGGRANLIPVRERALIQLPRRSLRSRDDVANLTKLCLHEIGHALGLVAHSIFCDDIMCFGWSHQRKLSMRDVYAIKMLYDENANAKIMEIIEAAVRRENKYALRRLGTHYIFNSRYREGAELLSKASELGDAEAQMYLGICYGTGRGVKKDQHKAIELVEKAVAQGHIRAHTVLGACYSLGYGVKQDFVKAAELFEYAASYGDTEAAKQLAILRSFGCDGGAGDQDKVEQALKVAESAGDSNTSGIRRMDAVLRKIDGFVAAKKQ